MSFGEVPIKQLAQDIWKGNIVAEEMAAQVREKYNEVQEAGKVFQSGMFYKDQLEALVDKREAGQSAGQSYNLFGVPYVIDDCICTKNYPTTCCSVALSSYQPVFDAALVSVLAAQGALLVGKTRQNEFGLGYCESGAAFAVSRRAALFGLGMDTAGEARQAAACCGVLGLKPTYGRISRAGLIGHAPSLEQAALLARRAEDLALVFDTLTGRDPADPTSCGGKFSFNGDFKDTGEGTFSIVVPNDWSDCRFLEDEVKAAFQEQIAGLQQNGFLVRFSKLSFLKQAALTAALIRAVEAFSSLANIDGIRFGKRGQGAHLQDMYLQTRSKGFGSRIKQFLAFGALVSGENNYHPFFEKAQKMRALIKEEVEGGLTGVDAILTPVLPFLPPALQENDPDQGDGGWLHFPESYYTAAANLTGYPALTVPLKTKKSLSAPFGLGLGIHFLAAPENEEVLLRIARRIEGRGDEERPGRRVGGGFDA